MTWDFKGIYHLFDQVNKTEESEVTVKLYHEPSLDRIYSHSVFEPFDQTALCADHSINLNNFSGIVYFIGSFSFLNQLKMLQTKETDFCGKLCKDYLKVPLLAVE